MRAAGANVEVHDDHFPSDATDEDWLRAVGEKGWIVLTKDRRIRYRPNEIAALKEAQVVAVVLVAGNLIGSEMADLFVKTLRKIEHTAGSASPPALFTFGRDRRLKQVIL